MPARKRILSWWARINISTGIDTSIGRNRRVVTTTTAEKSLPESPSCQKRQHHHEPSSRCAGFSCLVCLWPLDCIASTKESKTHTHTHTHTHPEQTFENEQESERQQEEVQKRGHNKHTDTIRSKPQLTIGTAHGANLETKKTSYSHISRGEPN